MKTYTRMVIGECNSDAQAKEFVRIYNEHVEGTLFAPIEKFVEDELLEEEDGRMVVMMTTWLTREACVSYHSSRGYRQLVAKTQHLLIGDFVVKLFQSGEEDLCCDCGKLLAHDESMVRANGKLSHLEPCTEVTNGK